MPEQLGPFSQYMADVDRLSRQSSQAQSIAEPTPGQSFADQLASSVGSPVWVDNTIPLENRVEDFLSYNARLNQYRQNQPEAMRTRHWQQVATEMRRRFPEVEPDQLRATYQQMLQGRNTQSTSELYREQYSQHGEGMGRNGESFNLREGVRGIAGDAAARWTPNVDLPSPYNSDREAEFWRRGIPVTSTLIPHIENVSYQRAKRRIQEGKAEPNDHHIVARYERIQGVESERSDFESAAVAAMHVPAIIGEAYLGGRLFGAAGSAVPALQRPLQAIGLAGGRTGPSLVSRAAAVPYLGAPLRALGTEATAGGALGGVTRWTIPKAAAYIGAVEATMPSMWLAQSSQNALRNEGEWYHIQNLAPAVAMGYLQVGVLGAAGQGANGVQNFAGRVLASTTIGMTAQQGIDLFAHATRISPGYGLIENAIKGDWRSFKRHGMSQLLTFALFGLLHGKTAKTGELPPEVTNLFEMPVRLRNQARRQGISEEAMNQRMMEAMQPIEQAKLNNPNLTRSEALEVIRDMPEGLMRDYVEAAIDVLPRSNQRVQSERLDDNFDQMTEVDANTARSAPIGERGVERTFIVDAEKPPVTESQLIEMMQRGEIRGEDMIAEPGGKPMRVSEVLGQQIEAPEGQSIPFSLEPQSEARSFPASRPFTMSEPANAPEAPRTAPVEPVIPEAPRPVESARTGPEVPIPERPVAPAEPVTQVGLENLLNPRAKVLYDIVREHGFNAQKIKEATGWPDKKVQTFIETVNEGRQLNEVARDLDVTRGRVSQIARAIEDFIGAQRSLATEGVEGAKERRGSLRGDATEVGNEVSQAWKGKPAYERIDLGEIPKAKNRVDSLRTQLTLEYERAIRNGDTNLEAKILSSKIGLEIELASRSGRTGAEAEAVTKAIEEFQAIKEQSDSSVPQAPAKPESIIDRVEGWADKAIKDAGQKLFSTPFDVKLLTAVTAKVAVKIIRAAQAGGKSAYTFAQWSTEAVKTFGEEVKPHIQAIWDRATEYSKALSIKNEVTARERDFRGLPERAEVDPVGHTFPELRDRAMRESPEAIDALIERLKKEPTPMKDIEDTLVLRRVVELSNKIDDAVAKIEESRLAKNDAETVTWEAARDRLQLEYESVLDTADRAGSETGRGLGARRMMMNRDFTLARVVQRTRKAKGGDLSVAEKKKLEEQTKRIADLEKELAKRDGEARVGETMKRKNRFGDERVNPDDPHSMGNYARRLQLEAAEKGITDTKASTDYVHERMLQVDPEMSRMDTIHALTGYGRFHRLTTNEVSLEIMRINGELLQHAKLDSMERGEAPRATGSERAKPGEVQRELLKRVREKMKEGEFERLDPHAELRTPLDAVMTRMRNEIESMNAQIERGIKDIDSHTGIRYTAETLALKSLRDAKKAEFDQIFFDPQAAEAKRVALAERSVERSMIEVQRRINERDLWAKKRGVSPTSPKLEADRAKLEALRAELDFLRNEADPNRAYVVALTARKAKLLERKANGDYGPRPERQHRNLSKDELKLKLEVDELKRDIEQGVADYKFANATPIEKVLHYTGETINLARSLFIGGDGPPILRQGAVALFTHPLVTTKALVNTFRSFGSKEKFYEAMAEIYGRENYENGKYKTMNLELTTKEGSLGGREESFRSNWIGRLPYFAGMERAHTAFMNRVRADLADVLLASLMREGDNSAAGMRIIGNYINVATGRGEMYFMKQATAALSYSFLSPRFVVSRFEMALGQPLWHNPGKGTLAARKVIAGEYARLALSLSAIYGVAHLAGVGIEWDPRSSNFLKFQFGNTFLDPLGGIQSAIVFTGRMATGETKNRRGEIVSLRDVPWGRDDAWDVAGRFVRGKLTPLLGSLVTMKTGRTVGGEEQSRFETGVRSFLPLTFVDFAEAIDDLGLAKGSAAGLWAFFGGSTQTRQPQERSDVFSRLLRSQRP